MKYLLTLFALLFPSITLLFPSLALAQQPLVLINEDATTVILITGDLSDPSTIQAQTVTPIKIDAPTSPIPPRKDTPDQTLTEAVKELLEQVPDHPQRADSQRAIAGIYSAVGQEVENGTIPTKDLSSVVDQMLSLTLGLLGTKDHWKDFLDNLKIEFNSRQYSSVQEAGKALQEISVAIGPEGESIVDILPEAIAFLRAVVSKDLGEIFRTGIAFIQAIIGETKTAELLRTNQ